MLPERIDLNKLTTNLVDDKESPYEPLYSRRLVNLKTLKIYIEINLANNFIKPSNSLTRNSILVIQKANGSFCLCIDDQNLNNLIIKN